MISKRALFVLAGAVALAGLGGAAVSFSLGLRAARASVEPDKSERLEGNKPRAASLDLEHSAHADFSIDVPARARVLRWRLASKGSELSFSARRGHALTDEEHDFEMTTDGGKAEIVYNRFSEPTVGEERFFARVAWTFSDRPRTTHDRLANIPFTIEAIIVPTHVDGTLDAGVPMIGLLTPEAGGSATYRFDVPADKSIARIDITDSASDVDLFARPGSPFVELDDGVRFAQHLYGRETLVLRGAGDKPLESGPWFVDVVDAFDEDRPASFTLILSFDEAPPQSLLAIQELAPAIGTGMLARALAAVVEIVTDDAAGSGTLLTSDGWILTNAHVLETLGGGSVDDVVVSCTIDPHEPAREMFRAHVERVDEARDMALVHVVAGFYSQPLPAGFTFPALDAAPNDVLAIGDPLWLVGYPSTGGRGSRVTISATRGIVSGFDQAQFGAVIKTDAEITSGNSGGAAVDSQGRLVGVPTSTVENGSGQIGYVHPLSALPAAWRELLKR